MRKALNVLLTLAAGACASSSTLQPDTPLRDFGTFNGGRIQLVTTGGFAALTTSSVVTHDDRHFMYVLRQLCNDTCAAAKDSASGAVSAAATDSLFNIALANIAGLKSDYGTSNVAADAAAYRLTVSNVTGTKTVTADDVTMPPPMRAIVEALHGTISAARK
jgi:hypothetical protein